MATLDFEVLFLNGEYNGEEWPPSPARFFQALIAGARYRYRRGSAWPPEFDEALRWLEKQNPPIIVAAPPTLGNRYTAFRPPNNLERELEKSGQRQAQDMHPRYVHGSLHYIYEVNDPPYEVLRRIARSVVSLGHGTDLVAVDVALRGDRSADMPDGETYYPAEWSSGEAFYGGAHVKALQVPLLGWYERLEENFDTWYRYDESTPNRAQPTIPPSYRGLEYALVENSCLYWIFRLETPEGFSFSYPAEALTRISAWVRHAASEVLKGKVSDDILRAFVLGHTERGNTENRLSYVPLPSVGSEHADGRVRRVMVAAMQGSLPGGIDDLGEILDQARLYDIGRVVRARLVLIDRTTETDNVSAAYTNGSDIWSTVTPVILHGHDFRNGKQDFRRTNKLLVEAFSQAGYAGLVDSFDYSKVPFNPWGKHVKEYFLPEHLKTWPRYHVKVKFRKEVTGPVLAGIGKHYGMGLFVRSFLFG